MTALLDRMASVLAGDGVAAEGEPAGAETAKA